MIQVILKVSLLGFISFLSSLSLIQAQTTEITGTLTDLKGEGLIAQISIKEISGKGTLSDVLGKFTLSSLPEGNYTLKIQAIGYQSHLETIILKSGENKVLNITLKEDILGLDQIVVSANRREMASQDAPVKVSSINQQMLKTTQSVSLSEGLNYSSGLRLENNCQNCGFTQIRMNGLEGAYSQVLINSRPIFSALVGVYGLDFIPSNMIERIEIVRGAGSVLYGGNAIGGTINILTKEPAQNQLEIGTNIALIDFDKLDHSTTFNATLVDKTQKSGISLYGFQRNRAEWDANQDTFSEITRLRNTTLGMDAFLKTSEWSKLKLSLFYIDEFRRGGNGFDLEPHQTDLTEQLNHQITGGNIEYSFFLPNRKHKFSVYTSAQSTQRQSYYGGGGRVLRQGDTLTDADVFAQNAYGNTKDLAIVQGLQYNFDIQKNIFLTLGTEYQYNEVIDEMAGYDRLIDQKVGVLGNYAQIEWNPSTQWTLLLGGRFDLVNIKGNYTIETEQQNEQTTLAVPIPRFSVLYSPLKNLRFRAGYAQGYRAPQAFNEDLHIEVVGGAALFTRLAPDLQTERSHSLTGSLDYELNLAQTQIQFTAEGFYTKLQNPFITSDPVELPSGVALLTKRNGSGATVAGTNLEAKLFFSPQFNLQIGATWQLARYQQDESIWSPSSPSEANQDSLVSTRRLLRTPNFYGFFIANFKPSKNIDLSFSGVYTGSMQVPHIINTDTEYTAIKRSATFLELGTKICYDFEIAKQSKLEVFLGMHNILNSFQSDFDRGAKRDAGYVYGPARPRTLFFGLTYHL
jgi:outer membrane receptor for ferrienterochelin and colicins